jgi:dynein intermediate chain
MYNRSVSEKVVAKDTAGQQALHSFEAADDYVFDVKWHPNHPAMFGTVDGSGKFDLWNLNQDIEVSYHSPCLRAISVRAYIRSHKYPLQSHRAL